MTEKELYALIHEISSETIPVVFKGALAMNSALPSRERPVGKPADLLISLRELSLTVPWLPASTIS